MFYVFCHFLRFLSIFDTPKLVSERRKQNATNQTLRKRPQRFLTFVFFLNFQTSRKRSQRFLNVLFGRGGAGTEGALRMSDAHAVFHHSLCSLARGCRENIQRTLSVLARSAGLCDAATHYPPAALRKHLENV